jgi:hypothetical protein
VKWNSNGDHDRRQTCLTTLAIEGISETISQIIDGTLPRSNQNSNERGVGDTVCTSFSPGLRVSYLLAFGAPEPYGSFVRSS